ncbi:hypothetical protein SAMN04488564_104212 [Lentzea waywayandensis]|uniref:Uncharacterized protein n=1 Tax=Lentzea waywayandensis TaxID=84724 RepID=A0A1I6ED77_9PSEU|nr:hypothetical protein SAMN04488564_104212 [Lentzea waywayandensis]
MTATAPSSRSCDSTAAAPAPDVTAVQPEQARSEP